MCKEDQNWCKTVVVIITLLFALFSLMVFYLNIFSVYLKNVPLVLVYVVFFLLLVGIIDWFIVRDDNPITYLSRIRDCLSENGIWLSLTFIIILFLLLEIFFIYPPQQIVVEPQKYEETIPAGGSLVKTFSIKYLGISNETISVNITKPFENWINISRDFKIDSEQTKIINFSIKVPLGTSSGEYRGAIKINQTNNTIAEIPISLIVQPQAQFQVTTETPAGVNISDWFKIKVTLKNIGDSPVYGIKIRVNESDTTGLNLSEIKDEKIIDLLPKTVEYPTDWWTKINKTEWPELKANGDWPTIRFDINSTNAQNQTLITKIKVEDDLKNATSSQSRSSS